MSPDRSTRGARRLSLLFLAVVLIPAIALAWLTLELVDRDRALEKQRPKDRAEQAADVIIASFRQKLAEVELTLERLTTSNESVPPKGMVLAVVEGEGIDVVPRGGLVFYPVLPASDPVPPEVFAQGERLEHQLQNLPQAAAWFRALTRSENAATRAGALLRLGRVQGKAGQVDAALAAFDELSSLGQALVDRYPAGLLALAARCGVLEKAGRRDDLIASARTLRRSLASGKWALLRDTYDAYAEEARRWTGDTAETIEDRNALAIASAFQSVYEGWVDKRKAPAREWIIVDERLVLVASPEGTSRLSVLIVNRGYLEDAWKDLPGARVALTDGAGRHVLGDPLDGSSPSAERTRNATQLPWTLRVSRTPLPEDIADAAARQRYLIAGLTTVILLLAGSGYFTYRGMARELGAARLQSDFVSAVSHEFRTPLASIRHLSDLLVAGRVPDDGQRQQCYAFLSRESDRLESLVEGLLDFGRIEGGAYRYRFEHVDADDLVRTLVAEFQDKVAARGYAVELAADLPAAPVRADREALSRAIWNLLDNAVKYSPDSKIVWVTMAVDDGSAVIRVRDRGLGIPLDEQGKIFGKFVRGSNAQAQQIKGTGIGLAMVRHIVEAHQGEVRVDSRPDEGSTFSLRLPIERHA
jgi:signal transduction histidine kinase